MLRGTKLALSGGAKIGSRSAGRLPPALATSGSLSPRIRSYSKVASCLAQRPAFPVAASNQLRRYATAPNSRVLDEPARVINYDDMKKLVDGHDKNIVLVDVREPSEYAEGHIGNAVNIPFKSMPGALGLDPAEFESTLGFPKPDTNDTLVFYCLGGVRSSSSEQLASTYGYKHRMNYVGSYQDWVDNEAKKNGSKQAQPQEKS